MSRHFTPRPSQRNNKTGAIDTQEPAPQPTEQPYNIYWWRSTKPWERTDQFFISFNEWIDPNLVHDVFNKHFEGKTRVFSAGFWLIIELDVKLSWREIKQVVEACYKELDV